jgi:hypothetical protein
VTGQPGAVIVGLDSAIHVLNTPCGDTWMTGSSPVTTS